MTSVGYGDQIPQTQFASVVAAFAMLFGAFFMAMPIAIIGNNFERAWDQMAPDLMLEDDDEARSAKALALHRYDRVAIGFSLLCNRSAILI